jgi:hypothetical protein
MTNNTCSTTRYQRTAVTPSHVFHRLQNHLPVQNGSEINTNMPTVRKY